MLLNFHFVMWVWFISCTFLEPHWGYKSNNVESNCRTEKLFYQIYMTKLGMKSSMHQHNQIQLSAKIMRSNFSWYFIRHCDEQWQNVDQTVNWQKTPHTSASQVSYGVSVARILQKIDCIITVLHCIFVVSSFLHMINEVAQQAKQVDWWFISKPWWMAEITTFKLPHLSSSINQASISWFLIVVTHSIWENGKIGLHDWKHLLILMIVLTKL